MSNKLPVLRARELIKILKKAGFEKWRQKGSHLTLYRQEDNRVLTVPIHFGKTIPKGTLRTILKEAGFKDINEFNKLRKL